MTESPLRILVLTELFLPTKGGTAVWFAEVYRRLGGKEIHIVTADVPGADGVDAEHPNSIHRLKLKRISWLRPESLGMYMKFLGRSLTLALGHRFTSVHAGRALPEGFVAWLTARLSLSPVVVYAHGEELTSWGKGRKYRFMRFVLRHADRVIANSEHTQAELLRMGVNPVHITLIYPGVDTNRFRSDRSGNHLRQELGLASDDKLILSVGRLQRRKGFDRVIESMPRLLEKGIPLHYALIGIGEDWDFLLGLAKKSGVTDRVHLLGHVSEDDLPLWYNACDLFAMPNREINGDTEGFGMVFIEAGACGKPVVAGQAGGTAAAVVDGVTGLRVDGEKTNAVAGALEKLLVDKEYAEQLGRHAHARALSEFSWEEVARKTRKLESILR